MIKNFLQNYIKKTSETFDEDDFLKCCKIFIKEENTSKKEKDKVASCLKNIRDYANNQSNDKWVEALAANGISNKENLQALGYYITAQWLNNTSQELSFNKI